LEDRDTRCLIDATGTVILRQDRYGAINVWLPRRNLIVSVSFVAQMLPCEGAVEQLALLVLEGSADVVTPEHVGLGTAKAWSVALSPIWFMDEAPVSVIDGSASIASRRSHCTLSDNTTGAVPVVPR
jgi:hypothetical protein